MSFNWCVGLEMVIILKRRIMSELLTTYLPTILILIIVYTTNFFKSFFFEVSSLSLSLSLSLSQLMKGKDTWCMCIIVRVSCCYIKYMLLKAVVTVNLTALLVLTTLFISVSGYTFLDAIASLRPISPQTPKLSHALPHILCLFITSLSFLSQ